VPLLIATVHKSPQHPLSLFQPAVSLPAVPLQRLLTVEFLQLHALKSSLNGGPFKLPLFLTHSCTELTKFPKLSSLQPFRTYRVENTVCNSTSIVACVSVAAGTCLPSRCLEMNVVSRPFASNRCFSGSKILALNKYATIFLTRTAFLKLSLTVGDRDDIFIFDVTRTEHHVWLSLLRRFRDASVKKIIIYN
jgi:hypothetical protein